MSLIAPIAVGPALVALVAALLSGRPAVGVALGAVLGAWWVGVGPKIPVEAVDYVWPAALIGAALTLASDRVRLLGPPLWGAGLVAVLWAPLTNAWPVGEGAAVVVVAAVGFGVVTVAARPLAAAGRGAGVYLTLVAGGASLALAGSGSLKLGLVAAALAAATAGATTAELARPGRTEAAEAAAPVLLLLLLAGWVYSALPLWAAVGFAAAPLGAGIARWDQGPVPWRSALAGLAVAVIGAGAVFATSEPFAL